MPPSEDQSSYYWRWLDWWVTPPWRALLTWAVLETLSVAAEGIFWKEQGLDTVSRLPASVWSRLMPFLNPSGIKEVVLAANGGFLLLWFEPLILRLNVLRSIAWLALRIPIFTFAPARQMWSSYAVSSWDLLLGVFLVTGAIQPLVLRGWRSRPWMALLSAALVVGVGRFTPLFPYWGSRWDWILPSVLYAAPLLYGTRLLTPEERERRQS